MICGSWQRDNADVFFRPLEVIKTFYSSNPAAAFKGLIFMIYKSNYGVIPLSSFFSSDDYQMLLHTRPTIILLFTGGTTNFFHFEFIHLHLTVPFEGVKTLLLLVIKFGTVVKLFREGVF